MNQKPNTYIVDPHTTANLKTVIVCQNKGIDHTWSHHQKVNNPNPLPYTRSQNNIPYQACWCLNPWLTVPASCLANASSRHPHPRGTHGSVLAWALTARHTRLRVGACPQCVQPQSLPPIPKQKHENPSQRGGRVKKSREACANPLTPALSRTLRSLCPSKSLLLHPWNGV